MLPEPELVTKNLDAKSYKSTPMGHFDKTYQHSTNIPNRQVSAKFRPENHQFMNTSSALEIHSKPRSRASRTRNSTAVLSNKPSQLNKTTSNFTDYQFRYRPNEKFEMQKESGIIAVDAYYDGLDFGKEVENMRNSQELQRVLSEVRTLWKALKFPKCEVEHVIQTVRQMIEIAN